MADIDYHEVQFWTTLVEKASLSTQCCKAFPRPNPDDPRPNKDLYELKVAAHPDMTESTINWNKIVQHGVVPQWLPVKPERQTARPPNHNSIKGHGASIRRHLRKGQLEGRYLIVDARLHDLWPELFIGPLAVVDKPGATKPDIRLINDYSFPAGASVNDYTDRSDHPPISYNPPRAIARRIHELKQLHPAAYVLLMLGMWLEHFATFLLTQNRYTCSAFAMRISS